MADKYLDYSGVELLWEKIKALTNKKLEKIEATDSSIKVTDKNKLAVNISTAEGNYLQLKSEGLYVPTPKNSKLTFGSDKNYVYDGTEDVTVPVYTGKIN